MSKIADRLREHCSYHWATKRGASDYPYGEHLQDCDICQGVEEIKRLEEQIEFVRSGKHKDGAYVGLPEGVHTYECPYWRVGQRHAPCVCGGVKLQEKIYTIFGPYGTRSKR